MAEGQNRARGLGRPLRAVLDSIADHPDAVPGIGNAVAPAALGDAIALVLAADPTVIAGWASGADVGVAGEVGGRHDAVWALVDDLQALRDSGRPVSARDDGRWHGFVVQAGDRAALGVATRAGALSPDTCALLHAIAAQLRRRAI